MRFIHKNTLTLPCIEEFVETQQLARKVESDWEIFPISYESFNQRKVLEHALIREQFGLCAYTGAGIQTTLLDRQEGKASKPAYWYTSHVEHLKCQSGCKREVERAGRDRCDDLNYQNVVAALEVHGDKNQHFGAVSKGDLTLPILPTNSICEEVFRFFEDGGIKASAESNDANTSIEVLLLDHKTLRDWRQAAIEGLLPLAHETPTEDLQKLVDAMDSPSENRLPEFCFVIKQIATEYLRSRS